ncbi:MAG: MBL fold metallo-hydrolase [bacterium]|nr:MBL fold metallo-hydrolase [bacterium]
MFIRIWGVRGSVPVSGTEYTKYGGDTTCIEIRTSNDEIIIVDAGSGIRNLGNLMLKEERQKFNLLFTHFHWDHLIGFPFFKPIYFPGTQMEVYGCSFVDGTLNETLSTVMTSPYFPVRLRDINANIKYHRACSRRFQLDTVQITPVNLSHPNRAIGYKFEENNKSFVFMTDNELAYKHEGGLDFDDYVDFVSDADLLFHDAEYCDKDYELTETWGHSRYKDAIRLALEGKVKRFGLIHHNQERSDNTLDEIVVDCQQIISDAGADIECNAVYQGMEITL